MRLLNSGAAIVALAIGAAMATPVTAQTVMPIADFELNGSTANTGTTGSLTNNGAVFSNYMGASGLSFGPNQGPTVTGISASDVYTVDLSFNFSDAGRRYIKIIDFSNSTSDDGVYSYYDRLSLYPYAATATTVFTPGTDTRLTISRDASGLINSYVNGALVLSYDDSATRDYLFNGTPLQFFQDENHGGEADSGFVDYIRIYNAALTPAQAGQASGGMGSAVPEPASWAMMIVGFGMVGAGLRSRRRQPLVRYV